MRFDREPFVRFWSVTHEAGRVTKCAGIQTLLPKQAIVITFGFVTNERRAKALL